MKPRPTSIAVQGIAARAFFILLMLIAALRGNSQGRVLINEYLPWPNNACGVTAEFIELFNFGPGPMNIGCYIVTDGDFAITIPPNTIIQPGQFYVLAGQNVIPQNCGNDLRNVTVNLNWNTCGCTSGTIPTTGDGLMTDGGAGNEQVVLLDPNLNVVDAVVRDTPVESSALITSSTLGGVCTARTFDLDNMNIQYETIGQSTGRGNSMARFIDGGCAWIKDTQESAGDPNNTPGPPLLDASLTVTNGVTHTNTGSALITVHTGNFARIFPMVFTLARDLDSNNIYNFNDNYLNGVDSTSNTVPVTGLVPGKYRIVAGTDLGCDLVSFDFVILSSTAILPIGNPPPNNPVPAGSVPIKVFPNPVKDRCIVMVNASVAGNAGIFVTDIYGKIVQAADYVLHSGKNECLLYTSQLPPGIYYIHLRQKGSGMERVTKIIKGI